MNYVLAQNNQVLLGPVRYSKVNLERFLEDNLDITFPLSSEEPSSQISISETVGIYPVLETPKPLFNSTIEKLSGPFWTLTDSYACSSYSVIPRNLEEEKSELKDKVANLRWEKETSGTTMTIQGKIVSLPTDREKRSMILQAYQLGAEEIPWKFSDGTWLTLSSEEFSEIVETIVAYVQSTFNEEATLDKAIDSAKSLAELDAISSSLNFNL